MSKLTIRSSVLLAALALAACGGAGLAPSASPNPAALDAKGRAGPPACKGQSTTTQFASGTGKLASRKGALCVPAFGGFGGSIDYPASHPSVGATMTSSTTNYNKMLPALGKGKPLFYLQIATSAAVTFGMKSLDKAALQSKSLKPGKAYDVYGLAIYGGQAILQSRLATCAANAVAGKFGGEISGVGSGLAGLTTSSPATIYLEIYPSSAKNPAC